MSSHLTRRVFRSILANEPIVHRGCLRRRHYGSIRPVYESSRRTGARNGRFPVSSQQQRTFFNLSMFGGGSKRDSKDADMAPGVEKMMEYVKMKKMRARLPPPNEVADAVRQFLSHMKHNKQLHFEDTQAEVLLPSLRYCLEHDEAGQPLAKTSSKKLLSGKSLQNATTLLYRSTSATASHVALAKFIEESAPNHVARRGAVLAYLHTLALSGKADEARQLLLQLEAQRDAPASLMDEAEEPELDNANGNNASGEGGSDSVLSLPRFQAEWLTVVRGYSRLDNETELLDTLDTALARGVERRRLASHMLNFYLRRDRTDPIKAWYSELGVDNSDIEPKPKLKIHAELTKKVLQWCLEHHELEFGHDVVRQCLATNPSKEIWDAIFVWAAGTGKGADEIDRMFNVMESANKSGPPLRPDISTINALVEAATSKNDPYLAERFIAIGKARDIHPDANTYVLQMEYRLKISDIDGALVAYKNLQSMDLSSNNDVAVVNELIVALCHSKRHDFDTIMNVAADLSDRKARFEPTTASALALLHLNRDEIHDVTDLMNTHAYHYSTAERDNIRRDLVAYCLDPETPLSRVWDAYNVLVETFDEMQRDERTQIMLVFFRRERPDVSVNIFNTMRSHYREDTIPTIDTYVAAFLGAAKLRDLDTLEVIHNQLKLDYNIDTNTYLLNALMIGYSACGNPRRALTFWDDIVASKEGPTYNSIHIALRACEKSPFGDLRAEKIWAKLRSMNIDLDQALWASYIAALAGNGNTEKAITALEEAESKGELEVDTFLIGSLFAGCSGQAPQADVEEWCKEKYPQIWEELERIGVDEEENGMRSFRIDRTVTP